jgi:hypothetical protein
LNETRFGGTSHPARRDFHAVILSEAKNLAFSRSSPAAGKLPKTGEVPRTHSG